MRPQEAQPQWRGRSGNLDSAPAGTPSAGPGGSGAGPLMCSAGAGASSLSWALPASACPGGGGILGCVPAPCAPGPVLLYSRSRPTAPSAEPPPEPLQLLRVPPGPAVRAAALRELGALSWARSCCYCPREPEGILALLGPAPPPWSPFPPGRSVQLLLLRDGALLSWGHSPRPQTGSSWAPPPWRPFVSLFLFPRLPT